MVETKIFSTVDSFRTKKSIEVNGKNYSYFCLQTAAKALGFELTKLPNSLKVLLENLLRYEDGKTVTKSDIEAIAEWVNTKRSEHEISYRPARVLMQDFTGVPAVVDLASMRDAMEMLGGDPQKINPLSPVDLVIDHSVQVDKSGTASAFTQNVENEMARNKERYEFLRWGQKAFSNFRVVPPGTGICHQVNLEYLAQVVWTRDDNGESFAYPDTLVGTDSHTTMINGLSVLGWGVGGIEAEAAMLGQPISMMIPEVIGFELSGTLKEGTTATDLVLTITQILRERGVVGKFVEFFGSGLDSLTLADRATISNMAPEYGATCGFFPIDQETIKYLELTGRDSDRIALVEAYAKAQGLWRDNHQSPVFTDILSLNISTVEPCISGPKRPQDKIMLSNAADSFKDSFDSMSNTSGLYDRVNVPNKEFQIGNGDVVIAAITSCTNTSNPSVMLAAGLVAKKANALGLQVKPWVKTSLAPGSKVVTEYLERSDLQKEFDALGFNLVGYGCTTCIGNSGPLDKDIEDSIVKNDLVVTSVLSGNRNFEGRVHPLTKANYLMSPPLVVAYALSGSMAKDLLKDPIGKDSNGKDVFLNDIWPTHEEIKAIESKAVTREMFMQKYSDVFSGTDSWQSIKVDESLTYQWNDESTYVKDPPYFAEMASGTAETNDIMNANILALLGDSITTDHISPAGSIAKESPAAKYLEGHKITAADFNSYGSRRGNHEVMMRGTFANIRIRNEMAPGTEGGYTTYAPNGEVMSIYDAAMKYQADHTPLVVIAGKEYGTGSSRDWAAKGTLLLGVKAVICESFERIHRSNLVGMGVLPLTFIGDENRKSLKLTGYERIDIRGLSKGISPRQEMECTITYEDGSQKTISLLCRLDTADEVEYFQNQGILHHVIRNMMKAG